MVKEIRHTGLVVSDLEKSIDFWTNVIGFEIVEKLEEKW